MMSQYHMMPHPTQTYIPMFGYPPYHLDTTPETAYVLDLSVKRQSSPDYTVCYPSPKMSPTYGSYGQHPGTVPVPNFGHSSPISSVQSPKFMSGSSVITNGVTTVPKMSPASISDGMSESSYHSDSSSPKSQKNKPSRPFKTLSKDCLTLSLGVVPETNSGEINNLIQESMQAFAEFREKMMDQIKSDNGTNKNMRRTQHNSERLNDPEYLEKRRKNNEAAKKSRDSRKMKQDEMAIRMAFLEREHMMLRCRLDAEKEDLERMQKITEKKLQR